MEKKTPKVDSSKNKFLDLLNLCNDTKKPNAKAREELHKLINTNTNYKEAMKKQQGMYPVVLRSRIESMNCSDSFKEVMIVKCSQLRDELGYETSNPLEKLAIEHIVICWLNHHETEIKHTNALANSHNFATGIYWEKRLTFTSRRYNRAIELLSKMRKMKLVVQVNTATNQIVSNRDG